MAHKPEGLRATILVGSEDTACLAISHTIIEIMQAHELPCELEVLPDLDHSYLADFAS